MKLPSRNLQKMLLLVSQDGYKDGLQKKMLLTTSKLWLLIRKMVSKLSSKLPALMLLKFSETELLPIELKVKSLQTFMMKKLSSQLLPSLPMLSMTELFKTPTMLLLNLLNQMIPKKKEKMIRNQKMRRKMMKRKTKSDSSFDQCQG